MNHNLALFYCNFSYTKKSSYSVGSWFASGRELDQEDEEDESDEGGWSHFPMIRSDEHLKED